MTDKSDYMPWLDYSDIWKSEAEWLSYIRGGIRKGLWEKNPIKLRFMNESVVYIENDNPRSMKRFPKIKGYTCAICGWTHRAGEPKTKYKKGVNYFECDHKEGGHSLRTISAAQSFIEGIVFVRTEDLQMLCKPCHYAKTYSEKEGVSFDMAVIIKKVIAMEKAKTVLTYLEERDIVPAKNAKQRRQQCIEEMMKCT